MTPEEAKPRTLWDYENKFGDERGDEAMFAVQAFTAKETAEIAKAYAKVFNGATASELPYPSVMEAIADAKERLKAWENVFKEWIK